MTEQDYPNMRNQGDHEIAKESITVEGITEDYVWYHSTRLKEQMQSWGHTLERVTTVMENRHKEHLKIIGDLLEENKKLKAELDEVKK